MQVGHTGSEAHRFRLDALPRMPWKNGGGTTREVASQPPGAGFADFDWRVSVATIAASGPFSAFPGIDRTIMLLDGDGVRLRGSGVDHLLDTVGEPFAFSGDVPIEATLIGGESTDVNVMTRRARCRADVDVVAGPVRIDPVGGPVGEGLVLCLRGVWCVGQGRSGASRDTARLDPGEGLWWAGAGGIREAWPDAGAGELSDPSSLAVVRILRR